MMKFRDILHKQIYGSTVAIQIVQIGHYQFACSEYCLSMQQWIYVQVQSVE